jgi:hypothetical protein
MRSWNKKRKKYEVSEEKGMRKWRCSQIQSTLKQIYFG